MSRPAAPETWGWLLALLAGYVANRVHRGRIIAVCLLMQGRVALILVDPGADRNTERHARPRQRGQFGIQWCVKSAR